MRTAASGLYTANLDAIARARAAFPGRSPSDQLALAPPGGLDLEPHLEELAALALEWEREHDRLLELIGECAGCGGSVLCSSCGRPVSSGA